MSGKPTQELELTASQGHSPWLCGCGLGTHISTLSWFSSWLWYPAVVPPPPGSCLTLQMGSGVPAERHRGCLLGSLTAMK